MFFRRLMKSESTGKADVKPASHGPPAGMQAMGANLQSRFAKGVNYNMKLIIKGDRNVGKSCLLQRLQGQKFKEEYIPTDEIQVASINWNYKTTDDIIKVEVWDVVDKGRKKKKLEGLKLETSGDMVNDDPCLDADFVDVYKATHGVIMMMDITKQWTFDYIEREIVKVPPQLPILVLANHRDMGHHRTVTEDQVRSFIETLERPEGASQIRYAEASMRNGYGLKYVHKFFNLPFLHLQRETLLRQLETNTQEIHLTFQELDMLEDSDEQNYDLFLDSITNKRREQQEKLAEKAIEEAARRQKIEQQEAIVAAALAAQKNGQPIPSSLLQSASLLNTNSAASAPVILKEAPAARPIPGLLNPVQISTKKKSISPSASAADITGTDVGSTALKFSKSAPATPAVTPMVDDRPTGFISRLFGNKTAAKSSMPAGLEESPSMDLHNAISPDSPVRNVDEFSPDEGLDASFLDDVKETKASPQTTRPLRDRNDSDDSDDENRDNPLVAGYQDDLDSDDESNQVGQNSLPSNKNNFSVQLSSDDEEKVETSSQADQKQSKKQTSKFTLDLQFNDDSKRRSPASSLESSKDQLFASHKPESRNVTPNISLQTATSKSNKHSTKVDESSDDDDEPGVTVLRDEDLDIDSNSNAVESKQLYSLNFDDLDALEQKFNKQSISHVSQLDVGAAGDDVPSDRKSKKSKDKGRPEKDPNKPEKKHRKHKNKEEKNKEEKVKSGTKEKSSKHGRKKDNNNSNAELNDLEAFLGSSVAYESL